jgi:hypothetical protein
MNNFSEIGENIKRNFFNLYDFNISQQEVFSWLAARIDLPIEG